MALAALTSGWAQRRDVKLYGYIVDHHVRPESTAEADLVANRLSNLGIEPKILDLHANLVEPSVMERFSREGRRDLLQKECVASGIHHILHGHTLDDQIELFIMRFLKHSTLYGLAGMHPHSYLSIRPRPDQFPIKLIKPLLTTRKSQLKHYCESNNIEWVEDASNMDVLLTQRNAIRALLENREALPSGFSAESLIPLITDLQQIRETTSDQVKLAFMQLENSGDLAYKQGMVTLKRVHVFAALPLDVKNQLLLTILSLVSPLSVSQILNRRRHVQQYVKDRFGQKQTLLDVTISPTENDELQFRRSRPRSTEGLKYTVYKATKEWSEWQLVDNRFWIRWKLPEDSEVAERNINARVLYTTANSKDVLNEIFGGGIGGALRRQTNPLFMFDDPEDPYTLRSDLIIGYPTLGYCRGLHMEWQPVKALL